MQKKFKLLETKRELEDNFLTFIYNGKKMPFSFRIKTHLYDTTIFVKDVLTNSKSFYLSDRLTLKNSSKRLKSKFTYNLK